MKVGDKGLILEATVKDVGNVKTSARTGKQYQHLTLVDDSGEIDMTLFEDEVNTIPKRALVRITKGYVKDYQGKKQFGKGQWGGSIEVLDTNQEIPSPDPSITPTPQEPETPLPPSDIPVHLLNALLIELNTNDVRVVHDFWAKLSPNGKEKLRKKYQPTTEMPAKLQDLQILYNDLAALLERFGRALADLKASSPHPAKKVLAFIREQNQEKGTPLSELQKQFPQLELPETLKHLTNEGEIYSPKPGYFKVL